MSVLWSRADPLFYYVGQHPIEQRNVGQRLSRQVEMAASADGNFVHLK